MTQQAQTQFVVGDPIRLGDWMIDPRLNRLTRNGESIQIELKMMDVLVCLAEHAGELVERQQLIDAVWATEYVSENILTRAVAELRRTLGDDAKEPKFIETIHRRGYRLIAPVKPTPATVHPFPTPTVSSREERSPYPGLSAFTEDDAEFFFGRETEVAKLWRKLTSRRLLAVIGPSGVGKSSLLRAGLIPSAPEGWGTLICQPGEAPSAALARSLAPEFEGDPEAISMLVDISNVNAALVLLSRWRQLSGRALLIIDQFEELFTLNAADVQTRFAILLGRLARKADVHVLLSMRDDFLFRCHEQPSLSPIFDGITPISTPPRSDLRRALTEPAARFGFVFEGETIVEEMLDAVEGERGGLPLLAFAVARLWAARDRDRRLLTRESYNAIGGVSGALAQHAESALSTIGTPKLPIVREIFRNLVTAEGTRAVREWDELLSVFSDAGSESPAEVLRALIDARLLTSYEVREEDNAPTRQVEIVHESLLANWPRLVRWRTQDADAAQLRDQLRQAARTWDEHGRTDDYLWSGRAFREYSVWRESYPGGLSELEDAFAASMTSHATRRRRRRRIVAAAALAFALVVAGVFATLWRRSVLETHRAEAEKLIALAQVRVASSPTEALAYATASLGLADSEQARRMVLEALAAGPPATLLQVGPPADKGDYSHHVSFSPDGAWAELEGYDAIRVVSRDGTVNRALEPLARRENRAISGTFNPEGGRLFGSRWNGELRVWSIPDFELLDVRPLPEGGHFPYPTRRGVYLVSRPDKSDDTVVGIYTEGGETRTVGRMEERPPYSIDRDGKWLAFAKGNDVLVRSLRDWEMPPRRIGRHQTGVVRVRCAGDRIAAELESGELWIWPVEHAGEALGPFPIRERGRYFFDEHGKWLGIYQSQSDFAVEVWDLRVPKQSPTPRYRFPASAHAVAAGFFNGAAFVPGERWVATAHVDSVAFWPLRRNEPKILAENITTGTALGVRDLEFTPTGNQLLGLVMNTAKKGSDIRVWDLDEGGPSRTLATVSKVAFPQLAVDPRARFVAATSRDAIVLVPLAGGPVRRLEGYSSATWISDLAFDVEGRRLAACVLRGLAADKVIRVWDLEAGSVTLLGPTEGAGDGFEGGTSGVLFLHDGSLVSSGKEGLRLWNIAEGSYQVLASGVCGRLAVIGRRVAYLRYLHDGSSFLQATDLDTKSTEILPSRVDNLEFVASDPMGVFVVSAAHHGDGAVQVALVTGDEPHLLLGHERGLWNVAVSPDGRWIASAGHEGSVRLWPVPDISKPPLQTLPLDELVAKLYTLSNLRAVRDDVSPTGWKIEVGPFPGWAKVPTW